MESFTVGKLPCEIVNAQDFEGICRDWLQSDSFHHVVTLNPEMVVHAEQDSTFATAVMAADIRVPDGSGIIWAHWYVRSQFWSLFWSLVAFSFREVERVTGVDAITMLAKLAGEQHKRIYLLGGSPSQAKHTADYLLHLNSTLTVFTGPDHVFDISGPTSVLQDIQEKKPDILFVAYGAPKQTIWIERHRRDLPSVKIAVGVGGAFAILSEERPRAPKMLRKYNLEWLWRLFLEPSRWRRIWRATVEFPRLIQKQKQRRHLSTPYL